VAEEQKPAAGAAYEVLGRDAVVAAIRDQPKNRRQKIVDAIDGLVSNPRPANAEALTNYPGLYRIRFGGVRLIYRVDDAAHTVKLSPPEQRGAAYKPRRMQRRRR